MSFLTPQAELDYQDAKRRREVSYYVGNPEKNLRGHLYDFCVDVLGYDALSPTFHKPMLDQWDRMDLKRFRILRGLEPHSADAIDTLDLWPRGHIKTWCQRARVIKYYLTDSSVTVTWWHAVEDKAIESAEAIAEFLQHHKELRRLFPPGVLPAPNRKKFCAGGKFFLGGRRIGEGASMQVLGAGGEGTGGHTLVGVLDDFVGWNDVVDNQMEKKKQFFRATVRNVVLRTSERRGWIDAVGTHWAFDDPYVDWRSSPDWVCTVRACLETEGVPDMNGKPIYLSTEQIEKENRQQGPTVFAFQMMNDPTPSGERPWISSECEHTCTIEEAKGPGWVVVFSDPAPRAVGSIGWEGRQSFRAGLKNFWASVVVKMRRKGDLQQMILLDGEQSKEWGLEEGMDRVVKLGMKWRAHELYAEHTSTPLHLEALIRSKKELGSKAYVIGSRRTHDADDRLKSTYNANAKIGYIAAVADRAKALEIVVCDSFPLREEFFSQMKAFMPTPDGRTGIPFDDLANAVGFGTDPYFRKRYQVVEEEWTSSPYRDTQPIEETTGSRYVQW